MNIISNHVSVLPLLLVPLNIGMLWMMILLVYTRTKSKETLFLAGAFFLLACISLIPILTIQSGNNGRILFFSAPYHIGALACLGVFISLRLLLFTNLDWKSLMPEVMVGFLGLLLLNLPEAGAGTLFSLLITGCGAYRIWNSYRCDSFNWTFVNYLLFVLIGMFGLIGLWIPFEGGRFLYSLFVLCILVVNQLHLLDFVMGRLKSASVSSVTDPLTGLYNKGFLLRKAQQIALKHELSIIFIDIDNFKQLNDTKGHDHGDMVLKDASKILQDVIGRGGFSCRYGGEELVGIVTKGDAAMKAENYRALIEKRLGVTVSVGVATGNDDWAAVIKEADLAMYEAKKSGKNRVVIAQKDIVTPTL